MKKNIKSWFILSFCFLLIIISIICFINSRNTSTTQSITLTNVGFDTSITFQADCTEQEFAKYTKILKKTFKTNHKRFDQYHAYKGFNNIYTINHEAYDHPVEIDDITLTCIQDALKVHEISNKFDISYGAVMNIWHNYREEGITLNNKGEDGKLPSEDEINNALEHCGLNHIQINGNTISFDDPETQIDLGGIAKGYTAQMAKKKLNEAGLKNGFINAGGNIVLLGKKSDGSAWNIGIQSPDESSALVNVKIEDSNKSIVTSGDYQRYYTVDNKKYAHIIDPDTGYPASLCRSVTIITSDSTKADGLSTALFCLDFDSAYKLAKQEKVEAIWIFDQDQAPDKKADFETKKYKIYTTKEIKKEIELS